MDEDELTPEDLAAIEEGLADLEAGRVVPLDEAFPDAWARVASLPVA